MESYLTDLINRMLEKIDTAEIRSSELTVSFKAYRVAETLSDRSFIPELTAIVEQQEDRDKCRCAYFILAHLACNLNDESTVQFLINRLQKEHEVEIICPLLDRLQFLNKPAGIDLTPLLEALHSSNANIRCQAIAALKRTHNPAAEAALLQLLESNSDAGDLYYINVTLFFIGTANSIPYIKGMINHPTQDVSRTALDALVAIGDISLLPVFLQQLLKGRNKFVALLGVVKYGDASVIPNIVTRIKELVSKKRARYQVSTNAKTDLIFAMEFLLKYATSRPEAYQMMQLLQQKHTMLWGSEKKWLEDNKEKLVFIHE